MEIVGVLPNSINPEVIRCCVEKIHQGAILAFPTETVYGLGGDATHTGAIQTIFQAKNRPLFNPLIVHVPHIKAAQRYGLFCSRALQLAHHFWPGPLTLVLPIRAPQPQECPLSPLVTAGLDTVAIRVPAHPVAQALLQACGRPIAAPSANKSGTLSSTRAEHVWAAFPHMPGIILDAGPCSFGLESTIVGLHGPQPRLLRHGSIPHEKLEACLGGEALLDTTHPKEGAAPTSPGQLLRHYAPRSPLYLNCDITYYKLGQNWLCFGPHAPEEEKEFNLSPTGNLAQAGAQLFSILHSLDAKAKGAPIFAMPIPSHGLGKSINDRLHRAACL